MIKTALICTLICTVMLVFSSLPVILIMSDNTKTTNKIISKYSNEIEIYKNILLENGLATNEMYLAESNANKIVYTNVFYIITDKIYDLNMVGNTWVKDMKNCQDYKDLVKALGYFDIPESAIKLEVQNYGAIYLKGFCGAYNSNPLLNNWSIALCKKHNVEFTCINDVCVTIKKHYNLDMLRWYNILWSSVFLSYNPKTKKIDFPNVDYLMD